MLEKLQIIVEKGDNEWWGWINNIKAFFPTTVANTIPEVVNNIRESLIDWQEHEGKEDPVWSKVNFNEVEFEVAEYKEDGR